MAASSDDIQDVPEIDDQEEVRTAPARLQCAELLLWHS
jgi:hypothetical protein